MDRRPEALLCRLNRSCKKTVDTLRKILQEHWGYPDFRPQQRGIIEAALADRDVLALLPTSAGKSLCYQLPPLATGGLTLVISPLIALMEDQVTALRRRGIGAAALHSGLSGEEQSEYLGAATRGEIRILYVSPERLQLPHFTEALEDLKPTLLAVDEAHCVSQWGHDFRPNYLRIRAFRRQLPNVPLMALTGSATPAVRADIEEYLGLFKPYVAVQSVDRPNLELQVRHTPARLGDATKLLQELTAGSALVYCRSRRQTEALARQLGDAGIVAAVYHAGLTSAQRKAAQQNWMNGKVPVMVATTAFGMGVDKGDVRLVLHYEAPEDLESYYQEVGRAGRDGLPAKAVLLWEAKDARRLRESAELKYPDEAFLREVYGAVCDFLQLPVGAEPLRYYPFPLNTFCNRFGLPPVRASYALAALAQEGLWTLTETVFRLSGVQFRVSRTELELLQKSHPVPAMVATALLRRYGGIFVQKTSIREAEIGQKVGLETAAVKAALQQLHTLGVIDYLPAGEAPEIFFQHRRAHAEQLLLNLPRLLQLRHRHQIRTNAMLQFLEEGKGCRAVQLRRYFGEAENEKPCGTCDVCAAGRPLQKDLSLPAKIRSALKDFPLTVPELLLHFPLAQHQEVAGELRKLLDADQLLAGKDGRLGCA